MDNSERIKAAAERMPDWIQEYVAYWGDAPITVEQCAAFLAEHFGESAPEQNVARIYADGRWIHAECLLCEWSGVKWKARRGSGLPNAKAILQHSLRDHLLFKHVEHLPVLAPSVDTNAHRIEFTNTRYFRCTACGSGWPASAEIRVRTERCPVPADAPQEPTCAPDEQPIGDVELQAESSVLPSKSESE